MHWTLEELIGAFRCSFVPVQVLVVDDDVTSRAAARRALEHHGYSVIVAERGEDAVRLLDRTHTPVDLLLTEVCMPGCSGIELARALRERFPSLPVVFVSSDGFDPRLPAGISGPGGSLGSPSCPRSWSPRFMGRWGCRRIPPNHGRRTCCGSPSLLVCLATTPQVVLTQTLGLPRTPSPRSICGPDFPLPPPPSRGWPAGCEREENHTSRGVTPAQHAVLQGNCNVPTANTPLPEHLAPGLLLQGRYRLQREIGRGRGTAVFEAWDNGENRALALKFLALPESARQRLHREVELARDVTDHHCVPVFDSFEEQGVAWVVSELVKAPDLEMLLDRGGPLPAEDVAAIGRGVALALRAAHRTGLLHRHVAPRNILIEAELRARLTDLGCAGVAAHPGDAGDLDDYLAPELTGGHGVDPRSDLYSLGLSLHHALTGRLPERPADARRIPALSDGHRPSRLSAGVPIWLDDAIARATAALPADRFPSATRMLDALTPGETGRLARAG
jgi:CheY-like chemotaxis protein